MKELRSQVTELISKMLKEDNPSCALLDILNRLLSCCIHAEINKIS